VILVWLLRLLDNMGDYRITPDDPALLTEKVITLLSDAELRRKFGERGREIATHKLHPLLVAEQHVEVYRKILAR